MVLEYYNGIQYEMDVNPTMESNASNGHHDNNNTHARRQRESASEPASEKPTD